MCTVSIVPRDAGFRLACNRDERLERAKAERPRVRRLAETVAIWPTDPASGGTWIGANDRGLAAALLNRHSIGPAPGEAASCSRGTIIPRLLPARDLQFFVAQAALLPLENYEPFTLLAVQGQALAVITSTRSRMTVSAGELSRPVVFTSSSLGDSLVDGPRRALFARIVEHSDVPLQAQARYHRHCWGDRPAISVLMSRPDAATVSRTIIDVVAGTVSMQYEPITAENRGRLSEDGCWRSVDGQRERRTDADDSRLCTHLRNVRF